MSSVLLLTRGSAIAVDMAVIILTWIKTYGHWIHMRQIHIDVSVTDVLIRDGMNCFFQIKVVYIIIHLFVEYRFRHSVFLVSHSLPSLLSYYMNALILSLHRALLAMNIAQITTWTVSMFSTVSL
jgi:hypothetical protein